MDKKEFIEKVKVDFNIKKFLSKKVLTTAILLLIQLLIFLYVFIFMKKHAVSLWIMTTVFAIMFYFAIVVSDENSVFKMSWITILFVAPFFTLMLYISSHADKLSIKLKNNMGRAIKLGTDNMVAYKSNIDQIENDKFSTSMRLHTRYLNDYGNYPPYKNTHTKYFKLGEEMFSELLVQLSKAEKYIFLEYFIISEGHVLTKILEILKEKVSAGLDVRIIYDDLGVFGLVNNNFREELESYGIHVQVFNPLGSFFSLSLNNRNHRKIAVIDGKVGFTGGINIGDEYINLTKPYGHWKDTAIMLEGEAVWSLVVMFLSMWNAIAQKDEDFNKYKYNFDEKNEFIDLKNGVVQPYFDNSLDDESLVENIYISIISRAKKYVYITSPYLVPTDEIIKALKISAKSGVDVRILVPAIQDKKIIKYVNQSYYPELVKAGVKIYEYTLGFIHAKMLVSDDKIASIGTANFDFRSFYLNMECGCYMYSTSVVPEMKLDIDETIEKSKMIDIEEISNTGFLKRLIQALFRAFAPLM